MRKSLKMTLITMIIAIVICMLNVTIVKAASSSITGSKTVTVGESVTINASVNAGAWNVVLSGNGQTKELVGQTATQGNSSASTSITFTPNKAETYTFTLSGDITDYETEKTDSINKTCTITVKEKETSGGGSNSNTGSGSNTGTGSNAGSGSNQGSSGNSGSNSGSNNNSSSGNSSNAPSFTSVNETVYATGSVNVRQSWNSALKQLTLLQGTLTPEFKKDVTEYTVQVGKDVTELQLDAVPEDEKAKVTVEGNTDLKDGENKVTITVMAEDESKTVYTLIVNKTDKTAETGLTLNKLEIAGVTLTPTFTPDVYSYSINVATGTTSVDITAESGDEDATVEITGNTDLKDGENLITIMVKKGEGDKQQVTTYQITVNVGEQETVVTTEKSSGPNILIIICGVAAAIIVISIITLIVINRRNKMDYDDEDDDEDYANTTILNQNFNYADELKAKREEKNEAKKQSREEYLNSYKDTIATNDIDANNENNYEEDDDTTRKKRKGRHF